MPSRSNTAVEASVKGTAQPHEQDQDQDHLQSWECLGLEVQQAEKVDSRTGV